MTLIPGSNQPVTLDISNLSPFIAVNNGQAQVKLVEGSAELATAPPQNFSLAVQQQTSLTFDINTPLLNFEGDYRLDVTLDDEHAQQPWQTSQLQLTHSVVANSDRPEYKVRETATVDLTLHNPGPFVQDITLTLDIDSLEFNEVRSLTLNPGQRLNQSYSVLLPTAINPGLHPLTVTAQLPSDSQLVHQPGELYVPESALHGVMTTIPAAAGDTGQVTVSNSGGVDTTLAYDISVYDSLGVEVAQVTGSGDEVRVDVPLNIALPLPDQLKSGAYSLLGHLTNLSTNNVTTVYRAFSLTGLETFLSTQTDAETYLTNELIQVTATLNNQGTALVDGPLQLQIVNPVQTEAPAWAVFTEADGLYNNDVGRVVIDAQGNKWASHYNGLSVLAANNSQWAAWFTDTANGYSALAVSRPANGPTTGYKWVSSYSGVWLLDDQGDPFTNPAQSPTHQFYGAAAGNCVNSSNINNLEIDSQGRLWFTTGNGLCVIDDNGTPLDESDDTGLVFNTQNSGLPDNYIEALTFDDDGLVWIVTYNDIVVLDYGFGPFDTEDNVWYNVAPAGFYSWSDVAIDEAGYYWFSNNNWGIFQLDDNNTPLNSNDDTWTQYDPNDYPQLVNNADMLTIDQEGYIWVGSNYNGLSIRALDGAWHKFEAQDGPGSNYIQDITVDAQGNRWLAASYESDSAPGGLTGVLGSGLPISISPWRYYNSGNSDLPGDCLFDVVSDAAGNIWVAGTGCELGSHLTPPKVTTGLASPLWQEGSSYDTVVSRLSPGGEWTVFNPNPYNYGVQTTLTVDVNGDLWAALNDNYNGGLFKLAAEQWSTISAPANFDGPPRLVAAEGNRVWVTFEQGNSNNEGIAVYDLSGQTWTTVYQRLPAEFPLNFEDIAVDTNGDVWLATNRGARRVYDNGGTWAIEIFDSTTVPNLTEDYFRAVAIDQQGNRWLGAYSNGSFVISPDGSQAVNFGDALADAQTLTVDARGQIWFAYGEGSYQGAHVLNYGTSPFDTTTDDVWTIYENGSGLDNKEIQAMTLDNQGSVWLASVSYQGGLIKFAEPANSNQVVTVHPPASAPS